MPRNRPDRSREDKAAEILAIAQRLFLAKGYDGTTMAAIAREAGIATFDALATADRNTQ